MEFDHNNPNKEGSKKVVVIISISSDIGHALAKKYSAQGYKIIGTYRSKESLEQLREIPNCELFYCDIGDTYSINRFIEQFRGLETCWDIIISCPCNPLPLKSFFDCNFHEWECSANINSINQLEVIHKLHNFRNREKISNVIFFTGPGTNSAILNFSAYVVPKILLIKMCEVLDAENKDIKFFMVGPGWVKTKTHNKILNNLDETNPKYIETKDFIENKQGTNTDDIFECIHWLEGQDKDIVGGRNFAVLNDKWSGEKRAELIKELKSDKNMYKLRRYKNDFLIEDSN